LSRQRKKLAKNTAGLTKERIFFTIDFGKQKAAKSGQRKIRGVTKSRPPGSRGRREGPLASNWEAGGE